MNKILNLCDTSAVDHFFWLRCCLLIAAVSFSAAPAIPSENETLPLLGIQYIEDRELEYPDWDVPRGYDTTIFFGTYQVEVVRKCSEQIALRLGDWADKHSNILLKESDEPNRLVMHAKIPEYGGIIAFIYRVFRKPPRARFTADFIDSKGLKELTSELSTELNDRYQLSALAGEVRRDMRCLKQL